MRKSILSVLALICSGAAMIASAADFTVNKLNYNIISPEAQTVEAVENSSASGAVTIPETVTHGGVTYTVVQIAAQAFNNATAMTSVSIPSTITTIGDKAFNGCTGLTSIAYNAADCATMGTSDATAFYGCISVKNVSIGDAVRTIPAYAFKGLTALRSITIPENVSYVGDRAFQGCTSIAQVNFNATECNSMSYAFEGCTNTANLYIGDNVKVVPQNAFHSFSGLTSVTIGKAVKSLGYRAFFDCRSLTKVTYNAIACDATDGTVFTYDRNYYCYVKTFIIGDEVKIIPSKLLYGDLDSELTSIIWGKNLEEIQEYAFYKSNMTSLSIPSTVKKIGNGAFASNGLLQEVKLNEGLTYLSGFRYCTKLATINIPSTVETIGNDAFYGCTALSGELKLPAGLKSIEGGAFYDCTGISGNLTIPDNTAEIGNGAFQNTRITSLNLGKSLTLINDRAFYNCTALAGELYLPESIQTIGEQTFSNTGISGKLTLPKNLTGLGKNAFSNCSNLTSIHQKSVLGTSYSYSVDGYFAGCPNITEVTFEEGIQEVYTGLCRGLTKITTVTIPEGVKHIGQKAFYGCTELTNVSLPSTLLAIWSDTFRDCTYLDNVTLPNGLKRIESNAFNNCNSLKSITIPESIEYLGSSIFNGCNNMTSATFNAIQCESSSGNYVNFPNEKFTKMTIGKNVEIIPYTLLNSSSVKVVEWNAKAVRKYYNYNYGYNNTSASPVSIIGEDVTTFYGLNSPTVISYAEVPPTLYNVKSGATVYVPNAFAYQTNAEWVKYTICQSVTWKGTTDGETLSYTTNFPYELTLKEYQTRDGKKMETTPCTIGDY